MDVDFSSLAARIAQNVAGLRGCIITSRDGLVLGAYPADGEAILRPAWLRFAALGEVEKGFIEFAGELWVFVQRGPYASFSVSAPNARPGLILEELEQILRSAEEARIPREGVRADAAMDAPRSKPRTPLHPEPRVPVAPPEFQQASVEAAETPAAQASPAPPAPAAQPVEAQSAPAPQAFVQAPPAQAPPAQAPPAQAPPAQAPPEPPRPAASEAPASFEAAPPDANVDRVLLSQEFAQLLEETGYDDDE